MSRKRTVRNLTILIQEHLEAMQRDVHGIEYLPWKREVDDMWRRAFENINRNVHEFNKSLDTYLLKPASQAYGSSVPKSVRTALSNFSSNLGEDK